MVIKPGEVKLLKLQVGKEEIRDVVIGQEGRKRIKNTETDRC